MSWSPAGAPVLGTVAERRKFLDAPVRLIEPLGMARRPFRHIAAETAANGRAFVGLSDATAAGHGLLVVGAGHRDTHGPRSRGFVIATAAAVTAAMLDATTLAKIVEGIEALPEAFVVYDADDRLVYCNEPYRTLYPKVRDLMHEGTVFRELVRESLVRGQFKLDGDIEDWYQRRISFHDTGIGFFEQHLDDGRWIQVSERRTPSGGTSSIRSDITVLKEREAELRAAKAQAEMAIAAKTRFMAVIGHELRNPLNAIYGIAQVLGGEPLGPHRQKLVDSIAAAARSIKDLLDDLLDIARIEAGKLDVNLGPVDVRLLLAEVGTLAATLAAPKRLRTGARIAADVPALILADGKRLRQVLTNLVVNACKFTRAGTIRIDARLVQAADGPRVAISVSDTGPGIGRDDLPRLFEPFARLSGSDGVEGSGLGLSISKELCDAMGASIRAASVVGKGSRFRIGVPVFRETTAGPAPRPGARAERHLSVLVVDDDEVNLTVATALLARLGHKARTAAGGEEALRLVAAEPFDLVFLDIAMPELPGLAVAERIRSLAGPHRSLPIVAMTGNVLPRDVKTYIEAGMSGVVEKPIDLDQLVAAIRTVARPDEGAAAIDPENRLRFGIQSESAVVFDPSRLDAMTVEVGRAHVERILQEGVRLLAAAEDELKRPLPNGRDVLLALLHRLRADAGLFSLNALAVESGRIERRLKLGHYPEPGELGLLARSIASAREALAGYARGAVRPARSSSR